MKNRKVLLGIGAIVSGIIIGGGGAAFANQAWAGFSHLSAIRQNVETLDNKLTKAEDQVRSLSKENDDLRDKATAANQKVDTLTQQRDQLQEHKLS